MSQTVSEPIALVPWPTQVAEIALAVDLPDLERRAMAALATILPERAITIAWLANDARLAPERLARLARGEAWFDEPAGILNLPLRCGDDLLGWISVCPPTLDAELRAQLALLSAVLAPSYLALQRTPSLSDLRRAEIRAQLDQLSGIYALDPLLDGLCTLTQRLFPLPSAAVILRYRDSEWLELAYVVDEHGQRGPRRYWLEQRGLTGLVMKQGAPLYSDNYRAACEQHGVGELANRSDGSEVPIWAWMGVPLADDEGVFGALALYSHQPGPKLSPDDQALLSWLAAQVAWPLRNAERYERAAQQARQRDTLNRIARTINSSLDPEQVPGLIMERAPVLLDAEEGTLLLLDEETGELVFSYAGGPAGYQLLGQRLPPGKGVAGFVASSGQATIVNNVRHDRRFYQNLDGDTGFTTRSILAVPLRGIDGVKGVIEVVNRRDDAPFTDDDRALLEALADQALVALDNARRFASTDQALTRRIQELDRSNDRLRKILRASNALRVERQLSDLLQQIAGVVSESSGFRSAMIALVRREHTYEPYLQRLVAAGPAAAAIERLRETRVPLAHLEALLRPEFRCGSLTYLIEHEHEEYTGFWGGVDQIYAPAAAAAGPGVWHPHDALFCLLRDSRGELLGLLGVDDPEEGQRPSAEQIQILEILANQAAAAIENAYLYAEQQHSLSRMMALNGLGRALSTTLRSPQQIYELTASGMLEMSGASWVQVLLGSAGENALSTVFWAGTAPVERATVERLAREAIAARRSLSHAPLHADGESVLSIPLRGSTSTFGAICVGYGEGPPSSADLESLTLFASQAATAVESLHLLGEVRQGRDQLASIMASTREGMLLVGDDGRVAVANSAFYHLAGAADWPAAPSALTDLVSLPVSSLLEQWRGLADFAPGELEQLLGGVGAVAEGLESFVRGQLSGATAGARALEWSVLRATREGNAVPLADGDAARYWPILLTLRDITAAKETERLRQDLTNMMIHDLRSPLTSILTSIDMMFRGVIGTIPTKQREVLMIAYASAQNLLNMVNLLLDISRLEGGRMPLDRTPLELAQLVGRASDRLSVIARTKHITIQPSIHSEASRVHADSELLLRVLQNLLDNALKFSPKGAQILVEVQPYRSEDDGEAPMVCLAVRDSGPGIKLHDQEKIFTKFGQAGNRRSAGSGLGLTFCKLAVEAHGGRIWVESTPGEGSSFFVTLPVLE